MKLLQTGVLVPAQIPKWLQSAPAASNVDASELHWAQQEIFANLAWSCKSFVPGYNDKDFRILCQYYACAEHLTADACKSIAAMVPEGKTMEEVLQAVGAAIEKEQKRRRGTEKQKEKQAEKEQQKQKKTPEKSKATPEKQRKKKLSPTSTDTTNKKQTTKVNSIFRVLLFI